MRVYLCIPTMDLSRFVKCLETAEENGFDHDVIVHLNGMSDDVAGALQKGANLHFKEAPWLHVSHTEKNIGVTRALHVLYETHRLIGEADDILLFLHDDVDIFEPSWDTKLRWFFDSNPKVGLVGFGGAKGLGDPDLYQKPYQLQQLARRDFVSNMRDAEVHGRRIKEPTRVATLDLFSIAARREFLDQVGGWSWWPHPHHGLDNAICCLAARHGWETWVLPFMVHHHGGMTSTKVDFVRDFGEAEGKIHADGHVTLYEDFRDVLPLQVP